jgi:hypothetical protein
LQRIRESFGNKHTLIKVNLGRNYEIKDECFAIVEDGLVHNQTVTSLGNLWDTKIGVKLRESTDIILNINKEYLENQFAVENSQKMRIKLVK